MALHPQAQAVCDLINAMETAPPSDETVDAAREAFGGLVTLGAGEPEPEAVFAVDDHDADGVPVRVYRPRDEVGLPIVVYFHGGGWTIGSVEQFDPIVRQVANASAAIVVAPEYRLAPEHPFPAGLDDCWTALRWAAKNAAAFGGDGSRIAVMGDSAGGNISAALALRARDENGPELALQVLVYPALDAAMSTPSYRENADGYLLTAEMMRWFYACYIRNGADGADWRISPIHAADLRGVAPAVVITAEYDPLRDEGEAYAAALRAAAVTVEAHRYDGMIHAFFGLSAFFDASRDAMTRTGAALRRAFGTLSS